MKTREPLRPLIFFVIASIVSFVLGILFAIQVFPFDETPQTPVWQKTVHVTNAQINSWYLETKLYTPVPSVNDCLIVIKRENGKWDYDDAWIITADEQRVKLADQGLEILRRHITPIVDAAIPDLSLEVTIGYPILANKMLIMLDPIFDQNRQAYEELVAMVNRMIIERRGGS